MDSTSLGDRMKKYEKVSQSNLISRMPIIIRLDGKAFHTYTKGFDKPMDEDLHTARKHTMKRLCEDIQGVICGYSQSDEISLVLKDWDTYQTQGWFDNKLQKIVSVSASMCTAYFREEAFDNEAWHKFVGKTALFDSRTWNLPKEEVVNYLIWRQQDWERNSINMYAQLYYSHKKLQGKNCKELITLMEDGQGLIWGEEDTWKKRGEFWLKGEGLIETPIFKDSRDVIENLL